MAKLSLHHGAFLVIATAIATFPLTPTNAATAELWEGAFTSGSSWGGMTLMIERDGASSTLRGQFSPDGRYEEAMISTLVA